MIICTSCQHPNPPGSVTCALCQAPLQMTMLASVAPLATPSGFTSIGTPGITPTVPSMLVPITATNEEETSRAIVLPQGEFTYRIGWQHFQSGNFPEIDLAANYPERLVNGLEVAVSRRTGVLKRDNGGNLFLSCDMSASSLMWVAAPGEAPRRILRGDEAYLTFGTYIYLGKNTQGITLVVR